MWFCPDGPVKHNTAIFIGIGVLVSGWIVYDLLCLTPLVKLELAFAALAYILVVVVAYGLTHYLSGRAAYIHVGAMFGTIMAANVWMRILPAQTRMIAATREGKQVDAALATRAKLRSKHNTFMVVPLVFTMISNHFPTATYGSKNNWIILSALILAGCSPAQTGGPSVAAKAPTFAAGSYIWLGSFVMKKRARNGIACGVQHYKLCIRPLSVRMPGIFKH